jgi:hypothetical protein
MKDKQNTLKSKGLGDTVEKIFEATGVKKVVKLIYKDKDCDCDSRINTLNRIFPYNGKK